MCFDIDRFVDKDLASHLMCSICQGVMCCPQINETNPTSQQEPNGHKYCELCIIRWLNANKSCPDCREYLTIMNLRKVDRTCFTILKDLRIRCKYFDKGCEFITKLELIEQHELIECSYGLRKYDFNMTRSDTFRQHDNKIINLCHFKIKELKETYKHKLELFRKNKFNTTDWFSVVDILCAAVDGDTSIVKLIIENNIDKKNYYRTTGLQLASRNGRLDIVKLLIENNASINEVRIDNCNALMIASKSGHKDIVKLLLDNNADINQKDVFNRNAFMLALENGFEDIAKLFIERNVDVNEKNVIGRTALIHASRYGHKGVIKLLIENNAFVNEKDKNGITALMNASLNGYKDIVQLLIENNANINEKDNCGNTALTVAKTDEIRDYLTSNGAI